jgi:hypothetical protein
VHSRTLITYAVQENILQTSKILKPNVNIIQDITWKSQDYSGQDLKILGLWPNVRIIHYRTWKIQDFDPMSRLFKT